MDVNTIVASGTAEYVSKAEEALPGVIIVIAGIIALLFVWNFFKRQARGGR